MSEPELTPLERDALQRCADRGGTRCNDGGIVDTLLSRLCSWPPSAPLVKWQMNPTSRQDGYISLYTATEAGRQALKAPSHG